MLIGDEKGLAYLGIRGLWTEQDETTAERSAASRSEVDCAV